jgi:hypothetical protein
LNTELSLKQLTNVEETDENDKSDTAEKIPFSKSFGVKVNKEEIKIQVNKNKRILDHLTKFSQDIDDIKDKEGMSLLFYDFNGFKSSLS